MENFMNTQMKKPSLITRMRTRFHSFLKKRDGQSTTEYILILAIVVMIASKMKTKLNSTVSGTLDSVNQEMGTFNSQQ